MMQCGLEWFPVEYKQRSDVDYSNDPGVKDLLKQAYQCLIDKSLDMQDEFMFGVYCEQMKNM